MTTPPSAGSWSLAATVKPAVDGPAPAAEDPTLPAPREWAAGAEAVRTTVRWVITALAAVGALMFAKGFVATPELSWQEHPYQLGAAFLAGVTGLVGVGWLIAQATDLLRPQMYELHRLPPEFVEEIESAGTGVALPVRVRTVADLQTRLRGVRAALFEVDGNLVTARATATDRAGKAGEAAARAAVAELEEDRRILTHNLAVYTHSRSQLLAQAEYFTLSRGLTRSATQRMVGAGAMAAIGGIAYVLALSDPGEQPQPPAAPVVGEMVRVESDAGSQLWSLLGLAGCQAASDAPRVPVVVGGGDGSTASPYSVTTLPTSTCRAQTFTVTDAAALVTVPKAVKITYAPASASPTGG
ncbi:hypothetical protein [Arthrobacter sp. NEB 688]|uniref:hypothetical protein n=1 Tax=Arthrobacter sp. NEB 688 TaxID=904039 RepID=UPI0015638B5E|nr:hypothetical protein [Arthrobacter sp. NEB 688]QKE85304.1 hypothetical protein HL663_16065 [Arthrobacter sp. NEB 688]